MTLQSNQQSIYTLQTLSRYQAVHLPHHPFPLRTCMNSLDVHLQRQIDRRLDIVYFRTVGAAFFI